MRLDLAQLPEPKESPTVYLATPGTKPNHPAMIALAKYGPKLKPSILLSYHYLRKTKDWRDDIKDWGYTDWVLDSGAYTAHSQGFTIDVEEYIEFCLEALQHQTRLTMVFGLDVIGDEKKTLKNCERMWEAGIPAVPTYHVDEPEAYLKYIAQEFPKIALGGVAARQGMKLKWAEQCFARVWPKKIHGFAYGTPQSILRLPFHTTDSSNWERGPLQWGEWYSFTRDLSCSFKFRGLKDQNLLPEIEHYLKVQARARVKWRDEMEQLQ
jgi:hypothetical protein